MQTPRHTFSVVICTRDRGSSVTAAIDSVLAVEYPSFEVILVDQSHNQETERAIQPFCADPRFFYISSQTKGAGTARNIGIRAAQGEIIACTDDDCLVPKDWLQVLDALFDQYPQVGIVFTKVLEGPHDSQSGFIPAYKLKKDNLIHNVWEKGAARGIGASMAIRRQGIESFGYFDEMLGPGAKFPACEDGDLAVRALLHNWWVYETAQTTIIHYGFRTWKEGKELNRRNWIGIGAAYIKAVKCNRWSVLSILLYEALITCGQNALLQALHFKKPVALKSIYYLLLGCYWGLKTPVNSKEILFLQS